MLADGQCQLAWPRGPRHIREHVSGFESVNSTCSWPILDLLGLCNRLSHFLITNVSVCVSLSVSISLSYWVCFSGEP